MFSWKKDSQDKGARAELLEVPTPVSEALILICEKCGKKLLNDPDHNPARVLGMELKSKIKESGGKGKVRAVITGCLDVCPKEAIAVGISRTHAKGDEFYTIAGQFETAADVILERIKRTDGHG